MDFNKHKPAEESRLALPMLYDDVLFLYVFFNNLEILCRGKEDSLFVRHQRICERLEELEQIGVTGRIERLIVSVAPY